MTFQEILNGITEHRANPLNLNKRRGSVAGTDLVRKIEEIEWALQALAETLRDGENKPATPISNLSETQPLQP